MDGGMMIHNLKKIVYVDPISTEELENNYSFDWEKEGIFDNITNSYSNKNIYVMQKKD